MNDCQLFKLMVNGPNGKNGHNAVRTVKQVKSQGGEVVTIPNLKMEEGVVRVPEIILMQKYKQ